MFRRYSIFATIALGLMGAAPVSAMFPTSTLAATAAESLVENFHTGLLATMKQASSLGYAGRVKRLEPLVRRTFALQTMAQLIVGTDWSSLSAADKKAVVAAFSKWVVATYASRFDDYSGETFVTTGVTDGGRKTSLVNTEIRPQGVKLGYRVLGGRVVDIYLSGSVSQLAQWRSEFASIMQQQGVKGLIARMQQLAH